MGELLIEMAGITTFRRYERACLERVIAEHETAVIATAGGIVSNAETYALLLRRSHAIWLKARPEEHMQRVMEQGDFRPMAQNREAMSDLVAILEARRNDYARAVAQGEQLKRAAGGSGDKENLGFACYGLTGAYLHLGQYGTARENGEEALQVFGEIGNHWISAYCHMFGLWGRAFRFANVVGPRQTHGVGFDFVRRLLADPSELRILGDGSQSKSYIHVFDVVDAVLTVAAGPQDPPFDAYNVATGDYITVTEIAEVAVEVVGLAPGSVRFAYTGGDRGWKGDVPIVRLDTARINGTGWRCSRTSRQALADSMAAMIDDARAGRLT